MDLTANHGGYFEFRLCPINDRKTHATQECFDKNPLLIQDITGEDFKYHIRDRSKQGHMNMTVRLPAALSCRHCVMQWRYWTGERLWQISRKQNLGFGQKAWTPAHPNQNIFHSTVHFH